MLHPHVPDSLKHFGKHMLATFLGLLVALGMESWHQEHQRKAVAREALASVLAEVRSNQEYLKGLAASQRDAPARLQKFIDLLESLQDARASHRSWKLPAITLNLHLSHNSGAFRTAAWNMALASQSVQRFPRGQAESLTAFYEDLKRFQAFLDQPADYSASTAIGDVASAEAFEARLKRLDPEDLRQLIWKFRELSVRGNLVCQWASGLVREADRVPAP